MKIILTALLQDWRPKLGAIAFALVLWWWIEGRIAMDRDVVLTIASSSEDLGTPKDFQLLIQAPKGWVLTSPMGDSPVSIALNGSNSELQSFATRQCAASFRTNFDPPPDQIEIKIPISPEQLDWLRPLDAELLLKNVAKGDQQLKELTFQRVKSETIQLTPRDIEVAGKPSEAWKVLKKELRFEPNTITVTGPQRAIEALRKQIDAAQMSTDDSPSELLSSFQIPEGTRRDVDRMQALHSDLLRQGISMDPPEVHVFAKIRLENPVSIPFNRNFEDLHIIPAAAMEAWVQGSYEPQPWVVEMPYVESKSGIIDQTWLNSHVLLVLPLNTLDTALSAEWNVRIEPHLIGLDYAEQRFYEEHMIIRPQTPGNDFIPYTKAL